MFNLRLDLIKAIGRYPNLKLITSQGVFSLSGEVDLLHPAAKQTIDSFSVNITFPKKYPYCFPQVIETSGKIKRIPGRHIYTDTNAMCFAVKVEELMKCKNGISTLWFLDNILIPRLAEEYLVNNGGNYAHEFSHGTLGDYEFYAQKFNVSNPIDVLCYLKRIRQGVFPGRNEKCCCGSEKKFKNCHRTIFDDLKYLGDEFLSSEIGKFENFLLTQKVKESVKKLPT